RIAGQVATATCVALCRVERVGELGVVDFVVKGDFDLLAQLGAQRRPGSDCDTLGQVGSLDVGEVQIPTLKIPKPHLLVDIGYATLNLTIELNYRSQLSVPRRDPRRILEDRRRALRFRLRLDQVPERRSGRDTKRREDEF